MTRNDELPDASPSEQSGSERQLTGGAYYAKTIFDRYGIATSQRARLVEKIFDIAYGSAHRRVQGKSSWTVEDLDALAGHFGESLDDLFVAAAKTRAESATFISGDLRLKCQLWLGAELARPTDGALVAVKDGPRWMVVPGTGDLEGPAFGIRQLLLETDAVVGSRIAVLDDQPSITDSLCVFLTQAGFKADAYHAIPALVDALATHSYDAYVLDWVVGDETVGNLVETLRSTDSHCPIAILTGRANDSGNAVTDIAELVAKHDVRYFSKPLDPKMITAVLSRLIAARPRT